MQDMSPRTRMLAYVVFGLAGLIVVGGGFFWFKNKLEDKKNSMAAAEAELEDMSAAQRRFAAINKERKVLLEKSLPSDLNLAKSEYKKWLTTLAHSHVGINANVKPGTITEKRIRSVSGTIYHQMRFDLEGQGTFEQCMQLLDDYYAASFVHRISSLQLNPIMQRNAQDRGETKIGRIEQLKIRMTSEVMILPDADDERVEDKQYSPYLDLDVVRENHRGALTRDFFSPATELPEIDLVSSRAVSRGESQI